MHLYVAKETTRGAFRSQGAKISIKTIVYDNRKYKVSKLREANKKLICTIHFSRWKDSDRKGLLRKKKVFLLNESCPYYL